MIDAYQRVDYKAIAEFTSKSVINLAEYIKANQAESSNYQQKQANI